jgi:serine/threonine-protein kinase RsbW
MDYGNAIELKLETDLKYLELVENVTDVVTRMMGFEEDAKYWITMAVRESVSNAMLHGNKMDQNKRVTIRFEVHADNLTVTVVDQGPGFDPGRLPDPLAPENLLKPSGRGIFYIRSFMDEVEFKSHPDGMEIRMIKKLTSKL